MRVRSLCVLMGLVGALGCGSAPPLDQGPAPSHEPEMFEAVLTYMTLPESLPVEGDWPFDQEDANQYGAAFFLRYGHDGHNSSQLDLADQTTARDVSLVDEINRSPALLLESPSAAFMAGFALVEDYKANPDPLSLQRIDDFLSLLAIVAEGLHYYPDTFTDEQNMFGPTVLNAGMAILFLEHTLENACPNSAEHIATAETILAAGKAKAYDETRGFFLFSLKRDDLHLYPNIMEMIAYLRAYQLTSKPEHLDFALHLYEAVQPLKVAGEGRYLSPYSAKMQGAQTDDYTTFSSQNFTIMALGVAYSITGDPKFKQEIADILTWIRTTLFVNEAVGGRVLHHWMDGRVAIPSDPEFYCSGCQLQWLYLMWRLEDLIGP
ncbi:MAG: hypothetical protein HY906_28090 [Deltaproteobacteria bacterium]|nr:hypothetical protein [Deltaproteobacteria bacterium]